MIKYLLTVFITTYMLWSCPFDEANVEVTVLAHKTIYDAVKSSNFSKASKEIIKQKELYTYFEKKQ